MPILYAAGDPKLGARVLGESTALNDPEQRRVTLAFFDRPCRIAGKWTTQTPRGAKCSVQMDVNIPGPGLHALVWVKEAGTQSQCRPVLDNSQSDLEFVTRFYSRSQRRPSPR